MSRGISQQALRSQWELLTKDWYSIYQWGPSSRVGYAEFISEWIVEAFGQIRLTTDNLRQELFRLSAHDGRIELQTGIEQLTEKRFVRAMYNLSHVPALGTIADYEIPLKATDDADHGDIDLLATTPTTIMCVEAKHPTDADSVLKAVLQAFVYTALAQMRYAVFAKEFSLPDGVPFAPAVLVGADTSPGRQLRNLGSRPRLLRLIRRLNEELAQRKVKPFRFFLIDNPMRELETCVTTASQSDGRTKVVFAEGFQLSISEVLLHEHARGGT